MDTHNNKVRAIRTTNTNINILGIKRVDTVASRLRPTARISTVRLPVVMAEAMDRAGMVNRVDMVNKTAMVALSRSGDM